MKFTFDPAKNALNQEKHGYSLADAQLLDWEEALTWPDERVDYGEPRMAALAPMGDRLFMWHLWTVHRRAVLSV